MKKQTQFYRSENECNIIYNKEIREIYWIGYLVKTNPIQSQTKPILRKGKGKKVKGKNESKSGVSTAGNLKKQSQFAGGRKWCKVLYERDL